MWTICTNAALASSDEIRISRSRRSTQRERKGEEKQSKPKEKEVAADMTRLSDARVWKAVQANQQSDCIASGGRSSVVGRERRRGTQDRNAQVTVQRREWGVSDKQNKQQRKKKGLHAKRARRIENGVAVFRDSTQRKRKQRARAAASHTQQKQRSTLGARGGNVERGWGIAKGGLKGGGGVLPMGPLSR